MGSKSTMDVQNRKLVIISVERRSLRITRVFSLPEVQIRAKVGRNNSCSILITMICPAVWLGGGGFEAPLFPSSPAPQPPLGELGIAEDDMLLTSKVVPKASKD
jgi:hypothetical protein